jgi:excisionase family DNA binding protein
MNPTAHTPAQAPTLTRVQVAALLGVAPSTVAAWARSGRIACVYHRGRRRYYAADVHALLESTSGPIGDSPGRDPLARPGNSG